VLKLIRNIYGQKQAGRVWNQYLVKKLHDIGFEPSSIDESVFYKGLCIFIVYVDDGIFVSPKQDLVDQAIKDLTNIGLKLEDQGYPSDYVGVNINRRDSTTIELSQPALIQDIIKDMNTGPLTSPKPVPARSSRILHYFPESPNFSGPFDYQSAVGKLNYVAQLTRPDIAYAVHQCARFSTCPKKEHGDAIEYICKYLKGTPHIGITLKPIKNQGFRVYADADFSGNWIKNYPAIDPSTAKSRSGWIITYANCPILWASKLQGPIARSTTEAEYISLSESLRDLKP
jgi:hypothetical protein